MDFRFPSKNQQNLEPANSRNSLQLGKGTAQAQGLKDPRCAVSRYSHLRLRTLAKSVQTAGAYCCMLAKSEHTAGPYSILLGQRPISPQGIVR